MWDVEVSQNIVVLQSIQQWLNWIRVDGIRVATGGACRMWRFLEASWFFSLFCCSWIELGLQQEEHVGCGGFSKHWLPPCGLSRRQQSSHCNNKLLQSHHLLWGAPPPPPQCWGIPMVNVLCRGWRAILAWLKMRLTKPCGLMNRVPSLRHFSTIGMLTEFFLKAFLHMQLLNPAGSQFSTSQFLA